MVRPCTQDSPALAELMAKIEELQKDHAKLRDRIDELLIPMEERIDNLLYAYGKAKAEENGFKKGALVRVASQTHSEFGEVFKLHDFWSYGKNEGFYIHAYRKLKTRDWSKRSYLLVADVIELLDDEEYDD